MHLRKARKAKVAASQFVKRVISGNNVSPERKEAAGKSPRTPTSKQKTRSGSISKSPVSTGKRGRPPKSTKTSKALTPKTVSPKATRRISRSVSRSHSNSEKSRSPSTSRSTVEKIADDSSEKKTIARPRGRPRKIRRESSITKRTSEVQDDSREESPEASSKSASAREPQTTKNRSSSKSSESSPDSSVVDISIVKTEPPDSPEKPASDKSCSVADILSRKFSTHESQSKVRGSVIGSVSFVSDQGQPKETSTAPNEDLTCSEDMQDDPASSRSNIREQILMSPNAGGSFMGTEADVDPPVILHYTPSVKAWSSESPGPMTYKISPKLLLSSKKPKGQISEGKITKRRRSKIPDWEIPTAVFQTQFEDKQPEFARHDSPLKYIEDQGMGQKEFFTTIGIVDKEELKKADGKQHRNHRSTGGKLRRVCKPKISPEMVYRRFSLARGVIMQDIFIYSDDEIDDITPRVVGDKSSIMKIEQSKKGSLSPKMHDKYRQHCGKKIPLISIEKVQKEHSGKGSPGKRGKNGKESFPNTRNSRNTRGGPRGKSTGDSKSTGGKVLSKSKSFEMPKKGHKSSLTKCKSMPVATHSKRGQSKDQTLIKDELEEEDDGSSARRSARQRGSKRKQWWHLLRANPDEYVADAEWDKEMAVKEAKRTARIKRLKEQQGSEEEEEEEEKEPIQIPSPPKEKSPKKKAKKKTESDVSKQIKHEVEESKPADQETLPKKKKKKKKKKDEESEAQNIDKEPGKTDASNQSDIKSSKSKKKEGKKRKATDNDNEPPSKKVKDEPKSERDTENEISEKPKLKKKDTGEKDDEVDEKPELDIVILGENSEPLDKKDHVSMFKQVQNVLKSKGAKGFSSTGLMEVNAPPFSPQTFIEILARKNKSKRPLSPVGVLPVIKSDIIYRTKESECIAPHMCSVCWINDHMYCRNMKRIAREIPLTGRCIHYVPCEHFLQSDSPSTNRRKKLNRKIESSSFGVKRLPGQSSFMTPGAAVRKINFSEPGKRHSTQRKSNKDELACDEVLTESDSEPYSPEAGPPPGTELLKYELRARAMQIKRSLGFRRLPLTISPMKRKLEGWHNQPEEEQREDEETNVEIEEYASTEEVGAVEFHDPPLVPLTGDYIVCEEFLWKEGWRKDESVFMPNTQEDAIEKDQDDLRVKEEEGVLYEDSVYGENSQDSTETSFSRPSTREEVSEGELSDGEDIFYREKEMKPKRKGDSFSSIRLQASSDAAADNLKNKWTKSDDGTQVLTFTTKEIREKRPELLSYIKRAGLVTVITEKLKAERKSIQKMVKDAEHTLMQTQNKLEQHRCIMAAMTTEMCNVKDQMQDLKVALVDEESSCSKLREENYSAKDQVSDSEKKLNTLKRIVEMAKTSFEAIPQRSDVAEPGISADINPDFTQNQDIAGQKLEVTDVNEPQIIAMEIENKPEDTTETTAQGAEEQMEIDDQIPETLNHNKQEQAADYGQPLQEPLREDSLTIDLGRSGEVVPTSSGVATVNATSDMGATTSVISSQSLGIPTNQTQVKASELPLLSELQQVIANTASLSNLDSQVLNVQIEGGEGDGRMVMLELPLDSAQDKPAHTEAIYTGEIADLVNRGILMGNSGKVTAAVSSVSAENIQFEGQLAANQSSVQEIITINKPVTSLMNNQSQVSSSSSSGAKTVPILSNIFGENITMQDMDIEAVSVQQTGPTSNQSQILVGPSHHEAGKTIETINLNPETINSVLQSGTLTLMQTDTSTQAQINPEPTKSNLGSSPLVSQTTGTAQSVGRIQPKPTTSKTNYLRSVLLPQTSPAALNPATIHPNIGNIQYIQAAKPDISKSGVISSNLSRKKNSNIQAATVPNITSQQSFSNLLVQAATQSGVPQQNVQCLIPQHIATMLEQQPESSLLPQSASSETLPQEATENLQQQQYVTVLQHDNDNVAPQQEQQQQIYITDEIPILSQSSDSGIVEQQTVETVPQQESLQITQQSDTNSLPQEAIVNLLQQQESATTGLVQEHDQEQHVLSSIEQQPQQASTSGYQLVTESADASHNLVLNEEILLQNLDLAPSSLGQVQTLMINGQPYEVILQAADNV